MKYEVNFGQPVDSSKFVAGGDNNVFRIAVLGDFSGRSNTGELSIGDELAARKAHRVDVDNLDDVIARFEIKLALPISNEEGVVNVEIGSMEDFHPDELFERLQVFEKLASLRSRLNDSSSFEAAAKVVQSLLGQSALDKHSQVKRKSTSTAVPNRKRDDFQSLISEAQPATDETPIVELLKQVVGSCVIEDPDPQQEQFVATVDEAISETMRRVLHHPDFQAMESLWRSVELLVRRLETSADLQIVLYDITAEELAADLCASDTLEESGLFKLLVEQPSLDAQQGPLGLILGSYVFEQSPPHADLLGRISQIASAAHAPFVASISNDCINKKSIEEIHPLVKESWEALHALPTSAYLMLTTPNFMLRWPYGKRTDPIDPFEFEEFTNRAGISAMLWANSCFLVGLLLGRTVLEQGLKACKLGSIMTLDDLPFYFYVDEHGDQIPLPCTNRLLSEKSAAFVSSQKFAPVIGIKGRPEVRLGSFNAMSGSTLAGPWTGRIDSSSEASEQSPAAKGEMDDLIESDPASDDDEGNDELDAMLNSLNEDGDGDSESTDSDDGEEDLDALLNSLNDDDDDDDASSDDDDDDAMDGELAALLADL